MADCIDTSKEGYVLELGPGTGVITKAILKSGISADKLISLELAPHFAKKLQKRFPSIAVIEGDAINLSQLLQNKGPINTIISSLPFRSLPRKVSEKIFSEIQNVLAPDGQFIQFTYAVKNNEHFYPENFILTRSFMVWRNIPPAKVTVFKIK